jgi:putative pyruvate formate lyase activating enzyme
MRPSYLNLYDTGELFERIKLLKAKLIDCNLCPNNCKVDRTVSAGGKCSTGEKIYISSSFLHFGEEGPLVGTNGSGIIFFTGCNLGCIFCQNYYVSQLKSGVEISVDDQADKMLSLQNLGAHNINLATPTHYSPMIVEALAIAIPKGLNLPLVYNCGGYESLEVIKLLDGIIDIYMPDVKYSDNEMALKYSGVINYWDNIQTILKEMHRQVGDLRINSIGLAEKGLLVRHLVLPNGLAGTERVLRFISEKVSINTYINIMDQYYPQYKSWIFPELNRKITENEYYNALQIARYYKLKRICH